MDNIVHFANSKAMKKAILTIWMKSDSIKKESTPSYAVYKENGKKG